MLLVRPTYFNSEKSPDSGKLKIKPEVLGICQHISANDRLSLVFLTE